MTSWFAVKSLYRIDVRASRAEPVRLSSYEERIVLIRAFDFDEALQKAQAESRQYVAEGLWFNADGEIVETSSLDGFDAFSLSDENVGDGIEIYSKVLFVPSSATDDELVDRGLGRQSEQDSVEADSFEPDFDRLAAGEKPSREPR
jgi:hypothetical protein